MNAKEIAERIQRIGTAPSGLLPETAFRNHVEEEGEGQSYTCVYCGKRGGMYCCRAQCREGQMFLLGEKEILDLALPLAREYLAAEERIKELEAKLSSREREWSGVEQEIVESLHRDRAIERAGRECRDPLDPTRIIITDQWIELRLPQPEREALKKALLSPAKREDEHAGHG